MRPRVSLIPRSHSATLGRTTIGSVPDFLTDGEVSVNL